MKDHNKKGLSLAETIIAIGLASLLMIITYTLFDITMKNYYRNEELNSNLDRARKIVPVINKHLLNAGFGFPSGATFAAVSTGTGNVITIDQGVDILFLADYTAFNNTPTNIRRRDIFFTPRSFSTSGNQFNLQIDRLNGEDDGTTDNNYFGLNINSFRVGSGIIFLSYYIYNPSSPSPTPNNSIRQNFAQIKAVGIITARNGNQLRGEIIGPHRLSIADNFPAAYQMVTSNGITNFSGVIPAIIIGINNSDNSPFFINSSRNNQRVLDDAAFFKIFYRYNDGTVVFSQDTLTNNNQNIVLDSSAVLQRYVDSIGYVLIFRERRRRTDANWMQRNIRFVTRGIDVQFTFNNERRTHHILSDEVKLFNIYNRNNFQWINFPQLSL